MIKTLVISLFILALPGSALAALEPVTLQLKWKHQFQFAGYYAAKAKGFYQEAGLDVSIIEAMAGMDPVQEVMQGHAQFGVGTSELVLNRYQGNPVVVLAVIFQHSPLALVTLRQSGIDNIHKLLDRKVMIEPNSAELFAYLYQEGFTNKAFNLLHHSQSLDDLIQGRTDAMSVYITDELYQLKRNHIEFNEFHPGMSGIDFYGDNLFTLESEIKNNPQRAKAFRAASVRGWQYAMQHPEEIVQLIYQNYSQRHDVEHLRYEAASMTELMRPDLIEPGYMHLGRWEHIVQTYHQLGLLPEHFDVKSMLYLPNNEDDLIKLRKLLYSVVVILLALTLFLTILFRIYRQAKISAIRLNTLFDNAPLTVIVLDTQFRIQRWNAAATQTFQWKNEEIVGKNALTLVSASDMVRVEQCLRNVLIQHKVIRSENSNLRKDGTEILCEWMNAPFYDIKGKENFILCMARDITEQKRMERELEHAAHYDSLTALPNRALIIELMKQSLATAARRKTKFALLFMDLDEFKAINDNLGHNTGDRVLQLVADRLTQGVRDCDYAGRLAGDEFLIILQDIETRTNARYVANKIADLIAQPMLINGETLSIQASIGISIYPDDAHHIDLLIQQADHNMYQIKHKTLLDAGDNTPAY